MSDIPQAPQEVRIETERLLLRPFRSDDAAEVQRLAGDKEIADNTLHIPHPYPPGEALRWIGTHAGRRERGEGFTWAIVPREDDGQLIGAIGLGLAREHRRAELGYWIGTPFWGCGYGTEATTAVMEYGFGPLGLNRIHAYHFKRNPASGRVLQKCGLAYEGRLRKHVLKDDRFEDLEIYGTLASDWVKPAPRR
jgi:RimJ/RimL family protein N-acetyltransferase